MLLSKKIAPSLRKGLLRLLTLFVLISAILNLDTTHLRSRGLGEGKNSQKHVLGTNSKKREKSSTVESLRPNWPVILPVVSDARIAHDAVSHNGLWLQYLQESFKCDQNIVRTAVKQNPLAIMFASRQLRQDHKFITSLIDDFNLDDSSFRAFVKKSLSDRRNEPAVEMRFGDLDDLSDEFLKCFSAPKE